MIDDVILPKFSFFFQGSDYRADRNKEAAYKCREEIKSLNECYDKHRGLAGMCKNRRKSAEKCWKAAMIAPLPVGSYF